MKSDLFSVLESRMNDFTPAERHIANHILNNKGSIAFETAASLADKLGISAVTVGRFCRGLGYKHFRELKQDLRNKMATAPWLVGDQLTQFMESYDDRDQLRASLEIEIANLVEVYQMVGTQQWKTAVNKVTNAEVVHVVAFQTERGLGHLLAHSLQYVRDGVHLADLTSGHYAELFAHRAKKRCLMLIDIKRYSRQSYLVAERAASEKIPLVVITDKHCNWARQFTSLVFAVPSESGQFWDSNVPIACLINLFLNAVVARSGASVEQHLDRISELYAHFTGWTDANAKRRATRQS